MNLRRAALLTLALAATAALAWQTTRTLTAPKPQPLAALAPSGALLTIESPDFAALLHSWNASPEQKAWLASSNYAVFSNSRLFGRLTDAEAQFAAASQIPAATLLPQVAGRQSLFAWYDVGNLEFLYITRLPAAQAAQTDLLKSRGRWSQRQAGSIPFYTRTAGQGTEKRSVAFASTGGLFFLATREDLLANALNLLQHTPQASSITAEPWYQDATAALPPEATAPILHMVLNLDRIVPLPQFRTYWIQQNLTQMAAYKSATADLYRAPNAFREERSLLLKSPPDPTPPDPDLAPIAALAPPSGVYRATANPTPAEAVTALEEKLLGRAQPATVASTSAADPTLTTAQSGTTSDLETRIDTPAPIAATFSTQALTQALQSAQIDQLLTYSEAQPATALWVPIHNAIILHAAAPWSPQAIAAALQQSLRGTLTTSTLGIDFHATGPLYTLTGPKPLVFTIEGPYLILADSVPLLQTILQLPKSTAPALPATLVTGFNHTAQRAPYTRLTTLIDGTPTETPAFFSQNIRTLSDAFANLQTERLIERHQGPVIHQTVTYQWTAP